MNHVRSARRRTASADAAPSGRFTTRELSPLTLADFEAIAVRQGQCWCMFYQRPRPLGKVLSSEAKRARNRRDKARLVRLGKSRAILVYEGTEPVGWCQYGLRDELPRIDARREYKKAGPPPSDNRLWRITCFFIVPDHRGKGLAKLALHAALESIANQGGGIVEAYPVVSERMAAVPEWRWFGTPRMFANEGFRRVAPLGTSGLLMRKAVPAAKGRR